MIVFQLKLRGFMNQPYNIIHLESPYETLSKLEGQYLFSKILACRLKSYQQRYGNQVFPFGPEDFLSDIVAIQRNCNQQIVATFKYVSFLSCQNFSVEFPLFHTIQDPINDKFHHELVSNWMSQNENSNKQFAYMGSFTNYQDSRLEIDERRLIKDLITTAIVGIVLSKKIDHIIVTGIIPNGASNYIQWLGFEKLCEEVVLVKDINQSPAHILVLNEFSKASLSLYDKYRSFWDERNCISVENSEIKGKDEAA
ncbi:MAG: hypothetical protein COW00_12995 [Bdellovibrio sp. CG12_big_fil_rev_8_21_14_0_65_39_13]|nr:MAG: hypothetical protein COW78_05315 [Bdellovibrio sp. CG22_combo_CG10-13_8_21_14_all_39_27]PIQ58997.1 MAG: hypothetical protein COW00_12995 [Bdellovibrio sp. CG12_big_fil_rev_8_21_14_0_65_39_13]PIR33964.1 MAG: hypothetical protein COV37_14710 [Bdellovibrio sp. CG11_big_fil_rev_8_21_14_0_20_39_38]